MSAAGKLRRLFNERDRLTVRLAGIDQAIREEGRKLADSEGYRAALRPETLRQMVGAGHA